MNHFKTILTAGAFTLLAGAASAATYLSAETCALGDVTSGGSNASDCYGVVTQEGPGGINDSENLLNNNQFTGGGAPDTGLWGGGWSFAERVNDFGTSGGLTVNSDGTYSWAGDVYDEMLVILKQANSFAAYLFTPGIDGDGTWETTELAFGDNAGGLSHMSVYFRGGMSEVPVPAAGFLLLGGLGGLVALRRRKS